MSSSTLHRYCTGTHVPTDYGTLARFAGACGATPPELRELHRLWALADAGRGREELPVGPPVARRGPAFVWAVGVALVAGTAWWFSGKQRQQV
ncbi:hypothetical protein CLV71_113101 [Actinophytocola oryzae]|uniref:Helix-turn-helix protein n=2 Tax=Actinophytocola oryzae TaxID=502181 RepID=A0A4R7V7D5_9PSEU|nr:hypothetical protein CLV71_113101 [Actinophytocola oryzae]